MTKVTEKAPVALLYLRVSTVQQAAEGVSLEAQLAKCRLHCERMGWQVDGIFADAGISGREGVANRPELSRLIARTRELRAQGQNSVIVVYSVSRLARRQKLLYWLLDEKDGEGLEISSATESFDTTTPTGRAMLGMIAVFAALEADMVSERTRDALAHAKAKGTKLGQKTMRELSPETVEHVKKLYASGLHTIQSLTDFLNNSNYPTASGRGRWHKNTVHACLKQ